MYTSATDNSHYKNLDGAVDHIFTNGALYQIENFAFGITKPVTPVGEFFPVLVAWNRELAPDAHKPLPRASPLPIRRITAEQPIVSIWSRLDQFASVNLAETLVARRAKEQSIPLTPDEIKAKAEGVAFTIRNASDYFRAVPFESLNKRILSLYYGVLALAFAEMLASPRGPGDLNEVEGFTKRAHGLYTVPSATGDFGGLSVGLLGRGFLSQWLPFLGHDISHLPKPNSTTPTTSSDLEKQPAGTVTTLGDLLASLPEIGDLFLEVFQTAPSWIVAVCNPEDNSAARGSGQIGKTGSTYIRLIDASGRLPEERIGAAGWPIAEIKPIVASNEGGRTFRARVDHAELKWYEALPLHHSPFKESQTLILPVISGVSEYRTISMITLYALSIMVRYLPSAWRRVEGGDWDEHLALVKNALVVFERLLPEQFLGSIIGERIYARLPGGFL